MRSTRVLDTQGRNDLLRTGTIGNRLNTPEKLAFLDDEFAVRGATQGVKHHALGHALQRPWQTPRRPGG